MKKKGFTLIELLAVIVILAIIMVLAVPKVLDVIEKAEMQAYKESVELMVHTAKMQYELDDIKGEARSLPIEYIYGENGKDTVQINENEVGLLKFKGDKPSSGSLTLLENKNVIVEKLVSKNKKWCAIKNENEKGVKVGRSTDEGFKCVIEEEKPITDKKPCELEEDEDKVTLYIDSVSDLYKLSRDVNNGTSYEGKVIKLRNDLDMSDNKNTCGEESFKPIGTAENPFKGKFDGGAKTISNLTINLPNDDNVGLFGHMSAGEIVGLNLENINVTGKDNVGGLVGVLGASPYAWSTAREIIIRNSNITGNNYVGGLVGSTDSYVETTSIIAKANVTGQDYVGIIYGSTVNNNTSRIVEGGKLTAGSNFGIITGGEPIGGYYSNKVTINEVHQGDGFNYETDLNDINFYEAAGLDTWIGGDNNSTGYYFDYDDKGEIILKSVEKNPMDINLKGQGTKEEPYLIENEKDWKTATLQLNKVYKIKNDLNFSNNKFYMLGSYYNQLTGTLDGGAKTINNVTIHASKVDNIGIVGYMITGELVGLNIENINVTGKDNVGGLAGVLGRASPYAWSTAREIVIRNSNIIGNNCVGGLVGSTDSYVETPNIIIEANVTGQDYVGIIYGLTYSYNTSRIVEGGKLTAGSNFGIITGGEPIGGYYSNKVTINEVHQGDGFNYETDLNDINFYEAAGLDTWIGGDNNSTGYYFDYDDKGEIILKSVEKNPMDINLKGQGTKEEPYLIENEKDWKTATLQLNKVYKIKNDLNFSNNKFYMLGSYYNQLTGTLDGGAKTINNVTIHASKVDNIGIVGYMITGELVGLNIENINVTGKDNVGGLAGVLGRASPYAWSTAREIVIRNSNIIGNNCVGGLVGSTDSYVETPNIIIEANVTGQDYVGIIYGLTYSYNTSRIVEGGKLTAGSNFGIITGGEPIGGYYSNKVVINGTSQTDGFSSDNIGNLEFYTDKVETKNNGDVNNTGYYFDYVDSKKGIYVVEK